MNGFILVKKKLIPYNDIGLPYLRLKVYICNFFISPGTYYIFVFLSDCSPTNAAAEEEAVEEQEADEGGTNFDITWD